MLIVDFIQRGGFVMYPLLIVALIATYLIVLKSLELYTILNSYKTRDPFEEILTPLRTGDFERVKAKLTGGSPSERILSKGVEYLELNMSDEAIKDRLETVYEEELTLLEKGLNVILVLGEIMPMLGLLGTVSGMIHVFKAITIHGTANANALAGGISEALLTTQMGLILGIPTLFIYTVLGNKVDLISKKMRHNAAMLLAVKRMRLTKDV